MDEGFKPRGLIRTLILLSLYKGKRHGYGIMEDVEKITGKKPSAGEVYPFLQRLEREGYVRVERDRTGRRKLYELTDAGRLLVEDTVERMSGIIEAIVESKLSVCANCGVRIYEGGVEVEVKGQRLVFCCEHCAANYLTKRGIVKAVLRPLGGRGAGHGQDHEGRQPQA
ncbi:MAG: helix-turn-helix transcriptional regulator [Candidatus Korarchaeota archaeon]|nr:helix-turn-helix transcriptional regulator [Candidatus Korarchaeota archaeon]